MCGLMLLRGTAYGATALLSQAVGAGNHVRAGQLLQRMLLLHLALVLAVSTPAVAAAESVLAAVGTPAAVAAEAAAFCWIRLLGLPFVAVTFDVAALLAAQRQTTGARHRPTPHPPSLTGGTSVRRGPPCSCTQARW